MIDISRKHSEEFTIRSKYAPAICLDSNLYGSELARSRMNIHQSSRKPRSRLLRIDEFITTLLNCLYNHYNYDLTFKFAVDSYEFIRCCTYLIKRTVYKFVKGLPVDESIAIIVNILNSFSFESCFH